MPSLIMKYALAGCPPDADGVIAEKYTSAPPYTVPSIALVLYPKCLAIRTRAKPSNQINPNVQTKLIKSQPLFAFLIKLIRISNEKCLLCETTVHMLKIAIKTEAIAQNIFFLSIKSNPLKKTGKVNYENTPYQFIVENIYNFIK